MRRRIVMIAAICVAALEADRIPREKVFELIVRERARQDKQWGGEEHDARHSWIVWLLILAKHTGKLAKSIEKPASQGMRMAHELIRVAGDYSDEML